MMMKMKQMFAYSKTSKKSYRCKCYNFYMDFTIRKLETNEFPPLLNEIPEPPKQLYLRGRLPQQDMKCLAVVGSRKYTTYAKQVVEKLIGGLRSYNIAVVSGLAQFSACHPGCQFEVNEPLKVRPCRIANGCPTGRVSAPGPHATCSHH